MNSIFPAASVPTPGRQDDSQLGMDHLQLNKRAYNRCGESGCKTIADVEARYVSRRLSPELIGQGTSEEVASALRTFRQLLNEDGTVNWESFWKERPIVDYRLALTSSHFQRLTPDVLNAGLGILHLKKACSGLEAAGIRSVGLLIDAARRSIADLKNFGKLAHEEVVQALTALPHAIESDGTVDWIRYARQRQFSVIPEAEIEAVTAEMLLKRLPDICKAIIPQQFDDRAWRIFQQRWLAADKGRPTLESIGSIYGLTRERVRQIEEASAEAISKPIFEDDYRGLNFRLRKELAIFFIRAREHFQSLGLPAWRASRWKDELAKLWGIEAQDLKRQERLVMALLSYNEEQPKHEALEPLVFDARTPDKENKRIMGLVDAMHDALAETNVGLDSFGIALSLKKTTKGFKDLDEIPFLVDLCSSVECIGDDQHRLRFDYLKGRGEQAFRVLSEHGKPMHRTELLREINRRLAARDRLESASNLVNQITHDSRIGPIGKTGEWTLKEWGHETRSLIDLIEEALTESNKAMDCDDIAAEVLKKRAGAANSVRLLLSMNPERFRKVGPGIYALTAWKDSASDGQIWDKDSVGRFISAYFAAHKTDTVGFKALREAFSSKSGLGERSACGVLAFHPAISVEELDYKTRVARFNKDWETRPSRKLPNGRELQSDRIIATVRRKLLDVPSGELQLIEVVQHVEAELKVQRPNVYAAISQSDEIETVAVDGSAFKICRLRGRTAATFPQLDQMQNLQWKAECQRALTKLTVEEVDIGLFVLGRQFDQAMRSLLEAARDFAGLPVSEGNIKTLQTRIDWAVSNLVFIDKATLNLLRVERNERGHQPPTAEERTAVMKFSPFLAALYIDYLLLIESRIAAFRVK